jgi:hypothetical protein
MTQATSCRWPGSHHTNTTAGPRDACQHITIGGTRGPTRWPNSFLPPRRFSAIARNLRHHSVRGPRDACQQNAYGLATQMSQLGALETRPDQAELVSATETVFGHRTQSANTTASEDRATRANTMHTVSPPKCHNWGHSRPDQMAELVSAANTGFRPSHAICRHHSVRGPRDACKHNAYGLAAQMSQLGALATRPDGRTRFCHRDGFRPSHAICDTTASEGRATRANRMHTVSPPKCHNWGHWRPDQIRPNSFLPPRRFSAIARNLPTPQRPRTARRVPTECIRSRRPKVAIGGTGGPTRWPRQSPRWTPPGLYRPEL